MNSAVGNAARRELAVVLGLAVLGVGLVVLVAFAPWYEPVMAMTYGKKVVETIPAVVAVLVEAR